MNSEAKFHPDEKLLRAFAEGTLSPGLSVVLAAHVEQCVECRKKTSQYEVQAAVDWLKSDDAKYAPASSDMSAMISTITSKPKSKESAVEGNSVSEIHMLDHSVRLPRVLAKVASQGLAWKKLAGGINQASVTLDDKTQCEFLYMKPGSQVPVHKHQGNEVTLVLDGSFSDEMGKYEKSDFIVRDKRHTHQPVSEEGCLCFAVLDSPLTFTRGLARLLNPFLRYRFNRVTSMG